MKNNLNRYWAMEQNTLQAAINKLSQTELQSIQEIEPTPYSIVSGIAVIPITGMITKYYDICTFLFGGTSTQVVQSQIAQAESDDRITGIMLYIDSPGGYVSGVNDLAEQIASTEKPVWAFISDCGASAAYWIASACDQVIANTTAAVGSIGVYSIIEDTSKLYDKVGVSVKLIKAGDKKGIGVDGVPITDSDIADIQRSIDEIYEVFVASVATGRKITESKALELATGQTWIAGTALEFGLIDKIDSVEHTIQNMAGGIVTEEIKIDGANESGDQAQAKVEPVAVAETKVEEIKADVKSEPVIIDTKVETDKAVESVVDPNAEIVKAKADGYTEAVEHETQRMAALVELAKGSPSFVIEQFMQGHDIGTAAKEYAVKLEKELATRQTSDGVEPVAVTVADRRITGSAVSDEDLQREWESNPKIQESFPKKEYYVSYKKWEMKTK